MRSRYEAVMAAANYLKDDDDFIHVLLSVRREYDLTREQMKALLLVSAHPTHVLPVLKKLLQVYINHQTGMN